MQSTYLSIHSLLENRDVEPSTALLICSGENSSYEFVATTAVPERKIVDADCALDVPARATSGLPDFIIVDADAPTMEHLEQTIRHWRQAIGVQRVVIVSRRFDSTTLRAGLLAGACGYLLRPFSSADLRMVMSGVLHCRFVCSGSPESFSPTADSETPGIVEVEACEALNALTLSALDTRLLNLVALGHQNKRIAIELSRSEPWVAYRLRSLFVRLRVKSRAEAAATWRMLNRVRGS